MKDDSKDINGLTRRDFIRVGATGAVGVALSGLGELPVSAADTPSLLLPRRRYGRTGLEISALVGASDWSPAVIPLAVQSGVNYWHKAHRWTSETMPAAIKSQPRESYYLEVVVDRVGGDHMKGHIDEEQHYQFVKQCCRELGRGILRRVQVPLRLPFGERGEDRPGNGPGLRAAEKGGTGQAPRPFPASLQQHRRRHGLRNRHLSH